MKLFPKWILITLPCSFLLAQSTAPPASQAEQAVIADAKPSVKVQWTGDAVVAAQLDKGRLDQKGINLTVDAWRIGPVNSVRFDLADVYASIRASGLKIISMDRQYAGFSLNHKLTARYYYMQQDTIDRDRIKSISHRETSTHLVGVRILTGKKLSFDAGPGIAFCYQDKNDPIINGFQFDSGAFYSLTYKIDERWSYSHWTTARSDVANTHETEIDSQMALTGKITKSIGLQLKLIYNYEGVLGAPSPLLPPNTRNYLSTTVGFNYHL